MKIVTLSVYGFTAGSFRDALVRTNIDIFVDTRRRGVRGPHYAFANSQRLQDLLAGLGIRYVHRLDLAPSNETRQIQEQADHAAGILRRDCLAPAYIEAYRRDVLHSLDSRGLVASLGNPASLLIFCIERTPDTCHRSLLAARLADGLDAPVEHIVPRRVIRSRAPRRNRPHHWRLPAHRIRFRSATVLATREGKLPCESES